MHHALSSSDSVGVSGYELDLTSPAVIQPLLVFYPAVPGFLY